MRAKFYAVTLILSVLLSGCSDSPDKSIEERSPSASASAVRLASEVPWIRYGELAQITTEERFNQVIQDFEKVGCKRGKGEGIYALPESLWGSENYPLYLNRYPKEFFWGNNSEKIKVVLAALEMSLAMDKVTIKYLDDASLKSALNDSWQTWAKYSQRIAKQVCNTTISNEDESKALLLQMLWDFKTFDELSESIENYYSSEMEDFQDSLKPRCTEYPSDNPKYTVVKCTNLP